MNVFSLKQVLGGKAKFRKRLPRMLIDVLVFAERKNIVKFNFIPQSFQIQCSKN